MTQTQKKVILSIKIELISSLNNRQISFDKAQKYRVLVRILFVILFVHCCHANVSATTNRQEQKIGIVSLLGHRLNLIYLGQLAFSDESKVVSVKNWRTDEYLLSKLLLGKNSNCFQKLAPRAMRDLSRVYDTSQSGWLYSKNYDLRQIKGQLRKISKETGVEKWLLILKNKSIDRILDTDRHFVGYGLYRNAYHRRHVYLYAYTVMQLFDTRSGRILKSLKVASSRKLNAEHWTKSWSSLSKEKRLILRNTFNRMLATDLQNAVKPLCRVAA